MASSALLPVVLASSALAAAPTPQSGTSCYGTVANGTPTADQPNLMNYKFFCDGPVTAYTILATRRPRNFDVIDSFSTTANVFDNTGAVVSSESFGCEGEVPGDGINCNAGTGGSMGQWHTASGSFDLTDPYCKSLAPDAKPGTLATPQAIVQLIVTDVTGAQDGPFRLLRRRACSRVPDRAPRPRSKTRRHRTRP